MQRFSVYKCLLRRQRPSARISRVFSSLLVGIRANCTLSKVIRDKTGCHRFACNVSWAWFLLWAGSAAQHFYSNLPKTIPCVTRVRNLSDAETNFVRAPIYADRADSFQRDPRILPALHYNSECWLSAPERTAAHPPPLLVRNQNGLSLSVTAASSWRPKPLHRKPGRFLAK